MGAAWLTVFLLLSSLALMQVVEGSKARSSCPPGWFYYKANCYGYFRYPLSWSEAEFDCQAYGHGAHLASILDASEADIIASHISAYQKNQPVWIGLHDPEQNRRWKWNDGSMYNYRSWLAGQPDNYGGAEHCGELNCKEKFVKWNDRDCKLVQPYVCKYKP
ncbi:regenerating islet-derived protein 4-like [Mixophyes fleayi]|uniref:regenerating islet-derived protein 4-like n=1 Tax=Mixophyes fleayi TaxID=3061075 RepID=UPI003F4DA4A6